ncbi:FecR family protein [Aestuariibaculum lutulentum]|uniref:FecR domain-containing protein n=1 Tax=Aestuariibaculum lutulentum TaxID=2920935 RepID=A0ABS9RGR6_9FLAO|nr:FecR domain-containing protein [Aestuariibaculum lutulentum]MCH4552134.1 FecR domain-containing protein [Aestuariibaculum lutulentum]
MEPFKQDESFLARWIAGELTGEELENFRKSEDYALYNKINEASQSLRVPEFNKAQVFDKIQENTLKVNHKPKVKRLVPAWVYAAAAILVLAFGVFYFTLRESQYTTGYSEQLAVVLPDESKVQLNANSELHFKSFNWENNRVLELSGEAFFDVEKGQKFRVETALGFVEVLGTEFNVVARDGYFEVQCREGKVQVTTMSDKEKTILVPGKAVRIVNNKLETWTFKTSEPSWITGESSFYDTPMKQVILALENQYQITIDASQVDINKRYTGGFTHKDINLALRTVLIPMDFTYTFNADKRVIVLKSSN